MSSQLWNHLRIVWDWDCYHFPFLPFSLNMKRKTWIQSFDFMDNSQILLATYIFSKAYHWMGIWKFFLDEYKSNFGWEHINNKVIKLLFQREKIVAIKHLLMLLLWLLRRNLFTLKYSYIFWKIILYISDGMILSLINLTPYKHVGFWCMYSILRTISLIV